MDPDALEFYATPGPMTHLPSRLRAGSVPSDLDRMRRAVQGLLLHRDWAAAYGVTGDDLRLAEQHLRSTREVLDRVMELADEPVTVQREPIDRVLCICRHFALLQTAFLRAHRVPARVRCGFASYFDRSKWCDHWITERWDGARWVRDDPQVDELQTSVVRPDFDPHDQPPGRFLSGAEAWLAARAGDVDPSVFGIFDMWGLGFVAGNVVSDFACLNKVELLPWDAWSPLTASGPHAPVPDDIADELDEIAALVVSDDVAAIRRRYRDDDRLRVPADIVSIRDGSVIAAHLDLD